MMNSSRPATNGQLDIDRITYTAQLREQRRQLFIRIGKELVHPDFDLTASGLLITGISQPQQLKIPVDNPPATC